MAVSVGTAASSVQVAELQCLIGEQHVALDTFARLCKLLWIVEDNAADLSRRCLCHDSGAG